MSTVIPRSRADVANPLTVEFELTGPFFTKDPAKTYAENVQELMEKLAREGAEEVRRGFGQGSAGRSPVSALGDRVADHIIGRVVARPSRGGRSWRASGVFQVYAEGMDAKTAKSLMAAGSVLEGRLGVIRRVTRKLASRLRQVDLTKGIE